MPAPWFESILFPTTVDVADDRADTDPDYFVDLNLDRLIDAILAGKDVYNLRPFFRHPLHSLDEIEYRHEVIKDLQVNAVLAHVKSFASKMRSMREGLEQSGKLHYKYQKERWLLDARAMYCDAVVSLQHELAAGTLKSRGMSMFRRYLDGYVASGDFVRLYADTQKLQSDLASIRYNLLIDGNRITVQPFDAEPDYGAEIERTFERFKRATAKDYRVPMTGVMEMNSVEERIHDRIVELFPSVFERLDNYCHTYEHFLDRILDRFDREVQFYVAIIDFIAGIEQSGATFCLPEVTADDKRIFASDTFDLALAHKLMATDVPLVYNDFNLDNAERIIVVTGPNQGGKTTFARTFGQLHYFAALGCPVPGRAARLFLGDRLFTHFEREEDIRDLRGKLQDDLIRIRDILDRATPASIIIINEIFASTTARDALVLGKQIMERLVLLDALCVWVTFEDELSRFGNTTVSMVSTVSAENPAVRTYKILRRPADGLAFAKAIAEKHKLTYTQLMERMGS